MNKKLLIRRHALALAVATCFGAATGAYAQSTTGNLYGTVPAAAGETVTIESTNGLKREVPVDATGHYVANQLPLGTYTVTLRRDGNVVDQRKDIALRVGTSTDVSFAAAAAGATAATDLGGVTVTGTSLPPIDVTSVDSRTVITSEQLARLPLGRSAEAIARLAPGVVNNGGGFTSDTNRSVASFGGSAATENAYYINGFNTTDPLNGLGGLQLPYGAIDQQEVYTGGYSAQYGRSDGGVISQVGKRGSNEWHFGAQVLWEPGFARASNKDLYYTSPPKSQVAGTLYQPKSQNETWTTTVSAYAGGPLIKDKLFFFVAAEFERKQQKNVNAVDNTSTPASDNRFNAPRWYSKLDWNITDSNILEFTGASDKREGSGTRYKYNYTDRTRGAVIGPVDDTKTGGDLYLAKYTGYITDDLTVSAMYGEMKTKNYDVPGNYDPNLTRVTGITSQNPALNGGTPIGNSQVTSLANPGRSNKQTNFRFDVSYHIGDHTIAVGVDNMKSEANDQGTFDPGPGYTWNYRVTNTPNQPISSGSASGANFVPAPALFPNGAGGYYVGRNISNNSVSVRSDQRAQYIEDKWQLTDRWLLSLGLRNDQFTDYNPSGQAFITQTKPQWAPRLGASWDVYGDGSFKVFANAGRYYLGLPLNPATGAASGYVSTQQYYTYSGIAADGTPTGLTQMSGVVSANNSYGISPDPRTVTAKNLKAENQDEFIIGFDKVIGKNWIAGMKATQRKLNNAIDDYCQIDRVQAKATALGYNVVPNNSCYLINAGASNTFTLVNPAGTVYEVPLSRDEMGFQQLKRKYYSLETFVEHTFDGTWYGKFDYVFSRSYGNTEGQVRSDLRQSGASASEDWDNAQIMENAGGVQNNDHTHVFKAYGYWQVAPEWQLSGNLAAVSGSPEICLGYYGPDHSDPVSYGNAYHFCDGKPSPPGSHGRLPWTFQLDLGVTYRPTFADEKLAFSANVFNVLNQQRATFRNPNKEGDSPNTPNPQYRIPLYTQDPRYARLTVSYDF
ncbi:carboxypeptidase family protein [Luteibacter rhizovicinus]|uniref:Carboxypeptidase family protein n=1 Tax=Luteibacter rhizovicinus TaxID=242606 RepID=A0A4V6P462_9GAMM|nr:TonB-dependent receptor [Luteibacter rhizovicinus]TCV95879.1 carboxypeptidase family protein [Luteibacter rhizovicinus]